jgi:hypothetical protein
MIRWEVRRSVGLPLAPFGNARLVVELDSDDEEQIAMVERSAFLAGVTLVRLDD